MGEHPVTNHPSARTKSPTFVTGRAFRMRRLRLLWRIAWLARAQYGHWKTALMALKDLKRVMEENDRIRHITKGLVMNGRLYSVLSYPGGPSKAQDVFLKNELHRVRPIPGYTPGLLLMILAITKKCSLQCAHCFEWDNLNQKEQLRLEDLQEIVRKFQERGTAQIELSGGEPLNRFDDLISLLQSADTQASDFWILSSGYRLTRERAMALRAQGLTGISISLDHWDPAQHDHFRGLEGSFQWVKQAVENALEAGLVVGLSLTPIKSFCNEADLLQYAQLAQSWKVHFIRILEPRAVGHFAGQAVELAPSELQILEDFALKMQQDKAYRQFPIIDYYGTYQREIGCSGAGSRYLYIDTDGDYHACPFCQHKCGSAVTESIDAGIRKMQLACGCHAFTSC
jgi:MoaA/NifB/PqqE/SkfB family radical SAM enzyme